MRAARDAAGLFTKAARHIHTSMALPISASKVSPSSVDKGVPEIASMSDERVAKFPLVFALPERPGGLSRRRLDGTLPVSY